MVQFATSSSRWAALQCRNPLAADSFIYSVLSTKIYCRPTCPSRLARRANVVFHDNAAVAEADGFRPCKRCRPELKQADGDPQKIAVEKACALLEKEQDGEKWAVKALAKEIGLTESHFCRVFKKVKGLTVGEFRQSLVERRRVNFTVADDQPTQTHEQVAPIIGQTALPGPTEFDHCSFAADSGASEMFQNWQDFTGGSVPSNEAAFYAGLVFDDIDFANMGTASSELLTDPSTPEGYNENGMQLLGYQGDLLERQPWTIEPSWLQLEG